MVGVDHALESGSRTRFIALPHEQASEYEGRTWGLVGVTGVDRH
jgi:hypothetical protein